MSIHETKMTAGWRGRGVAPRPGLTALLAAIWILLAACQPETPPPAATAGQAGLTPYATSTLTPQPGAARTTNTPHPTPTIPPPPTPTPFTHEVKEGDTMLSIAFQYGLTLDQLRLANPEVDPNLMSVGMKLVIPLADAEGGEPEIVPTPTPLPVALGTPACYPAADGSAWCFILLENELDQAVENLSAQLSLYTGDGEVITSTLAVPPLNIVPGGAALPLMAHFSEYPEEAGGAQAGLLTALEVPEGEGRYLDVEANVETVTIAGDGMLARVVGEVVYATQAGQAETQPAETQTAPASTAAVETPSGDGGVTAGVVWLAVTAYDEDGQVVGVRKWEAGQELAPGESQAFEITVFSSGLPIARVEALVEARPGLPPGETPPPPG